MLLMLPPELRVSIYEYVFHVPSWEDHRLHSTTCQPCKRIPHHREFKYPPCRIVSAEDGSNIFYITGSCHAKQTKAELLHRSAILRTCRLIYTEAVDLLYANTRFLFLVTKSCHFGQPDIAANLELISNPPQTTLSELSFLPKIQWMFLRVAISRNDTIDPVLGTVHELLELIQGDGEHEDGSAGWNMSGETVAKSRDVKATSKRRWKVVFSLELDKVNCDGWIVYHKCTQSEMEETNAAFLDGMNKRSWMDSSD